MIKHDIMKPLITSQDWPPNIDEIRKHFELTGDEIFTYGKIIYNPNKKTLTPDLLAHESVHLEQQSGKAEEWWKLYLADSVFRAYQECPAHWTQYQIAKSIIKDRNKRFLYAKQLAMNLSSVVYGKMMTFNQAYDLITSNKPPIVLK